MVKRSVSVILFMAVVNSIYPIEQVLIGTYSGGGDMLVRQYGEANGAERALFFIGQIHGDESGSGEAVRLMEASIQALDLSRNTFVYLLNPASRSGSRLINGIDPNRDFLDQRLSETRAIADFCETLAAHYQSVLIVSAHQYNDRNRGTLQQGFVFPLYKLTAEGRQKVAGKAGNAIISMKARFDYTTPTESEAAARQFANITGFTYEAMWKNEMYPGELMYFVSMLGSHVSMIEFEIPESERSNIALWKDSFARFVQMVMQ
jgi:hypothetical protein